MYKFIEPSLFRSYGKCYLFKSIWSRSEILHLIFTVQVLTNLIDIPCVGKNYSEVASAFWLIHKNDKQPTYWPDLYLVKTTGICGNFIMSPNHSKYFYIMINIASTRYLANLILALASGVIAASHITLLFHQLYFFAMCLIQMQIMNPDWLILK